MGCGSRKTNTDISKQSSSVEQKSETKSEEKQTEQRKSEKSEENRNDITDVETVKTTTTEYDTDGKPIKQTTTETTRSKTDKSTNSKKENHVVNKTRLIKQVQYGYIRKTIEINNKLKSTSRTDWSVYAFFSLLGLNVLYFGIMYVRYSIRKAKGS